MIDEPKLKRVRRVGLPNWFIAKRCNTCGYREGTVSQIGSNSNIVTCEVELCPHIGKGYIKEGITAIERSMRLRE